MGQDSATSSHARSNSEKRASGASEIFSDGSDDMDDHVTLAPTLSEVFTPPAIKSKCCKIGTVSTIEECSLSTQKRRR